MNFIKEVCIKNFRAIDLLDFPVKRINIIVGRNNSGKSSLLEAIALNLSAINSFTNLDFRNELPRKFLEPMKFQIHTRCNSANIDLIFENNEKSSINMKFIRDLDINNTTDTDLHNNYKKNVENSVNRYIRMNKSEINIEDFPDQESYDEYIFKERVNYTGQIEDENYAKFQNNLYLHLKLNDKKANCFYINTSRKFSRIRPRMRFQKYNNYYQNMDVLNKFNNNSMSDFIFRSQEERYSVSDFFKEIIGTQDFYNVMDKLKEKIYYLHDIRMIDETLHIIEKYNNKINKIPFALMGDGFKTMLMSKILIETFKKGTILLEEPENSLHPGYMDIFTETIINNSESNQYFLTTHSLELIKYLISKAEKTGNLDKLAIIRLNRNEDTTDREILFKDRILEELDKIKIDLRGY